MSWAPQVIADNSGKFVGNALRFATKEEAEANVYDLAMRWILVRETRVVESDEPVNYRYIDGKLQAVEPPIQEVVDGTYVPELEPPKPDDGPHRKPLICCICDKPIPVKHGWAGGNNAEPAASGRCCDECESTVVIPLRIARMMGRPKPDSAG